MQCKSAKAGITKNVHPFNTIKNSMPNADCPHILADKCHMKPPLAYPSNGWGIFLSIQLSQVIA